MPNTPHRGGGRRPHPAAMAAAVLARLPLLALAVAAAVFALAAAAAAADPAAEDELVVVTDDGRHAFTVELARTAQEQAMGLMYRRNLPADHGMLFTYRRPREVSFWMRNTFVPLDILFIGEDGRIGRIAADTTPLSEAPIPSDGPVRAVLEVNAGTAERLGIEVGDRVEHPLFDDPPG